MVAAVLLLAGGVIIALTLSKKDNGKPEDPLVLFQVAKEFHEMGEDEEALKVINRARRQTKHVRSLKELDQLEQQIVLGPKLRRAERLIKEKIFDEARAQLNVILREYPDNEQANLLMKLIPALAASPGVTKKEIETKVAAISSVKKEAEEEEARAPRRPPKRVRRRPPPRRRSRPEPKPEPPPKPAPKPTTPKKVELSPPPKPAVRPEPKPAPPPKPAPRPQPAPKPEPTYGTVRILSDVPGAVSINGRPLGKKTPLRVKLQPGTYDVGIQLEGTTITIKRRVNVKKGAMTNIKLQLPKK
jgi:outer membrane biosynthesis protein TonB